MVLSSLPDAWIFDLDGTLADQSHRRHLAQAKRWEEYFWQCHNDEPIQDVIDLMSKLDLGLQPDGPKLIICSGRSEMVREMTRLWLDENLIYCDELFMRPENDRRPDFIVKQMLYDKYIKGKYNVLGVFDDRDQVVEMWRRNELRCYQVAPGNF